MAYRVQDSDYLRYGVLRRTRGQYQGGDVQQCDMGCWLCGGDPRLSFHEPSGFRSSHNRAFKSLTGVLGASVVGFFVCVYAAVLVLESRRHILVNWDRAKLCREQVHGLDRIWLVSRNGPWLMVSTQIGIVIFVFAIGFAALFAWALSRT